MSLSNITGAAGSAMSGTPLPSTGALMSPMQPLQPTGASNSTPSAGSNPNPGGTNAPTNNVAPGIQTPQSTPVPLPSAPTAQQVSTPGYNPNSQPGGLINTAQVPLAATTPSQAATWTATPEQTSAGQLNTILASNSPLMGQASLQADQATAARGLLNSSMTAGAEEQAMINSATPIATSTASTLAAAGAQNAQEQTQAQLATAAQANAAAQQQAGAVSTAQQSNAAAINTALQFTSSSQLTAAQTNAGNALQAALTQYTTTANAAEQASALQSAQSIANLQGQYSTLINSNNQVGNTFASLMTNIASIYSNPNIVNPSQAAAPLINSFTNYVDTMQNITGLNVAQNFQPTAPTSSAASTTFAGTPAPAAPAPAPAPALGTPAAQTPVSQQSFAQWATANGQPATMASYGAYRSAGGVGSV